MNTIGEGIRTREINSRRQANLKEMFKYLLKKHYLETEETELTDFKFKPSTFSSMAHLTFSH